MKSEVTQYGFQYGPALVERWCSDDKKGWVILGVKTKKHPNGVQVYVTKTGKVRVNGKEIRPTVKDSLKGGE